MSKFLSNRHTSLTAYTPGEQPKDQKLLKLNTNESPFPPSDAAFQYAESVQRSLNLYPDSEGSLLRAEIAAYYGVSEDEVLLCNGSDEVLNFAFMAFCDTGTGAVFPDITYGFYSVFANLHRTPYKEIPLDPDLKILPEDYYNQNSTIFIANPNAPTGRILSVEEVEGILQANPEHVVVVDEAYIDFGGKTCIPLIHTYKNLLVSHTFSKSRFFAGGRLGYAVADRELIKDLRLMKYSTNPYNVNSMTMALGLGIMKDREYFTQCCLQIAKNRSFLSEELRALGFEVLPSMANFVFAKKSGVSGKLLYRFLKEKSVLIRHFNLPKIESYIRISIGTKEEMKEFIFRLKEVLEVIL